MQGLQHYRCLQHYSGLHCKWARSAYSSSASAPAALGGRVVPPAPPGGCRLLSHPPPPEINLGCARPQRAYFHQVQNTYDTCTRPAYMGPQAGLPAAHPQLKTHPWPRVATFLTPQGSNLATWRQKSYTCATWRKNPPRSRHVYRNFAPKAKKWQPSVLEQMAAIAASQIRSA